MNPVKVYVSTSGTSEWNIWPSFSYNTTLDQLLGIMKRKGMNVEWKDEEGITSDKQLHTLVGQCIELQSQNPGDYKPRYYLVYFE
jgi:hypothetical protein